MSQLLEIKNLKTGFQIDQNFIHAVDGVSLQLRRGDILGIVGESGSGKSVTSLSILRLIQSPGRIDSGEIFFEGKDLLQLSESEMQKIRGNKISMIFQEPMTSLNPVFTIGDQIDEVIQLHQTHLTSKQVKEKTIEMLKLVGIPSPEKRYDEYPHQLSGGMRQRVMIAMSMSCKPDILIADEPTTALDVTIQAQILDLIRRLQKETGSGVILITHDLGVVAEMCTHVAIMYAGKIVEQGSVEDIFYRPRHPYTQGLLDSVPHFESGKKLDRLKTIPGMVPNLGKLPTGCRFQDRCSFAKDQCRQLQPSLTAMSESHSVACFYPISKGSSL